MQTAQAVVMSAPRTAEVREIPVPSLEPGAALVAVSAATLCGTDVFFASGRGLGPADFPYIVGHEGAGRIVELAGGVQDVKGTPLQSGDRVIWTYPLCGECYYCRVAAQGNLCQRAARYGRSRADAPPFLLGTCATLQYVAPRAAMVRIPDEVSDALASSASCALRTVMHGFELVGIIHAQETVVVQGAGMVGLYAAMVARARGARRVLVIGAPAPRLALARQLGADDVLDIGESTDPADRLEWVRGHTSGRGADVVFQCASMAALPEALAFARPGGRVVSIGGSPGPLALDGGLFIKGLTIFSVRSALPRHYVEALEFLTRTDVSQVEEALAATSYSLSEAGEALRRLEALEELKPVVVPHLTFT